MSVNDYEMSVNTPLDDEIIKADELVVALCAKLDKIKSIGANSEKRFADDVESLNRNLAASIDSLNNEFADYLKSLDRKIAESVSSLSFGAALRDKILVLREKLEQLITQQVYSQQEREQTKSAILEKQESTTKLEREIRNIDDATTRRKERLKERIGDFFRNFSSEEIGSKGCCCGCLALIGFIIFPSAISAISIIASSDEALRVFFGCLILIPLLILALFYVPSYIKKSKRRKTIAELQEQIRMIEQQQQSIRDRQQDLSREENHIRQEIETLTKKGEEELREEMSPLILAEKEKKEEKQRDAEKNNEEKLRAAEEDKERKQAELAQKRKAVIAEFQKNWETFLQTLKRMVEDIRSSQPSLDSLEEKPLNSSGTMPEILSSGLLHVTFSNSVKDLLKLEKTLQGDWQESVPNLLDFPLTKLIFDEYKGEYKEASDSSPLHRLLLRLLFTLPVGMLEMTVIDPLQMGRSLAPFLPLTEIEKIVPHKHFLTVADEIELALKELFDYANELMQKRFHGNVSDWLRYNEENPDNTLPYKLLFIFGFPEQCSDKSILYLKRLIEFGLRCGILLIITVDNSKIDPKRPERASYEIPQLLEKNGQRIDELYSANRFGLEKLKITAKNEPFPSYSTLMQYIDKVKSDYSQHKKHSNNLTDMWSASDFSRTSIDEISAPLGWTSDGKEIALQLGGVNTEHHVLLAGRSGSGKSNLLHVLIHGFLDRYSPDELNVYLLDYKQGTEFNVYTNTVTPQIKLVATESDTEYGITVLSHLADELKRRSNLFKQRNARDFKDYREKTVDKLPRVLLIIDEFQMMFQDSETMTKQADAFFNILLRQGRAFGIHVLLATQTLRGLQSTTNIGQLISQIGCRIALACNQEDSALILAASNWDAADLKSPPEAIINNQSGQKTGNRKFNIPRATEEDCADHLSDIASQTQKKGFIADTKIFNGSAPPIIPASQWFGNFITSPSQIVLGEHLNFDAQPFAFQWERRLGNNLCVAGIDDAIRYGILHSVLYSIQQGNNFDRVIYYNSYPQESAFDLSEFGNIEMHDKNWDCDLTETVNEIQTKRTLLIINSLDNASSLHPVQKRFDDKSLTPIETLLNEGPQYGSFVLAFVDNWKRFNNVCKSYVSNFEMCIGFQLGEDDAGSLVTGNLGAKFKGLDKPNKAIFINRQRNVQAMFRPFVIAKHE
ncbi:MAG: AAA family ATPase [Planctomycetaceae bacterium]|jgi:GTPase SAR1 family protein|nr:AAA family ATPase [Planctomycetaceae bacterium]